MLSVPLPSNIATAKIFPSPKPFVTSSIIVSAAADAGGVLIRPLAVYEL
jgi:hypothetical protein